MNILNIEEVGTIDNSYAVEGLDFIASGDQYLTFTLGKELYAIDILCVKEIRGWENPTLIPNSPKHVKGVINLRGIIVPIIDLRMQFAVGKPIYSPTTVVIVLTNHNIKHGRIMGYVVDSVSDVLNVEENEIKQAPNFGSTVPSHYINGLVNAGNDVITLLNIEALQSLEDSKQG